MLLVKDPATAAFRHNSSKAFCVWITLLCREVGLVAHNLSRSVITAVPAARIVHGRRYRSVGIGSGSVTYGNVPHGCFMAVAVGSEESMNRDDKSVGRWSKNLHVFPTMFG